MSDNIHSVALQACSERHNLRAYNGLRASQGPIRPATGGPSPPNHRGLYLPPSHAVVIFTTSATYYTCSTAWSERRGWCAVRSERLGGSEAEGNGPGFDTQGGVILEAPVRRSGLSSVL